ncbi:hypothetical protein UlMin_033694 [Ulmus minor]
MRYRINLYKLGSILEFLHRNNSGFQRNPSETAVVRYGYSINQLGLQLFSSSSRSRTTFGTKMVKDGTEMEVQPPPVPANSQWPKFPYWARWLLGSLLTSLTFPNQKWNKLRKIEGEAEMVVEEVKTVAEVVEKVATVAEKVSLEVAEKLPENSKLKHTALFVEHLAENAAQDAQITKDFIHKVDELKHELESLKVLVEPVVEAKEHESKSGK